MTFLNLGKIENLTDVFYIIIEVLANVIVVALSAALIGPKLILSGVDNDTAWAVAIAAGVVVDLAYLALFGRLPKAKTIAEYSVYLIGAFVFMALSVLTSMLAVQEIIVSGQAATQTASANSGATAMAAVNWQSVIVTVAGIASNVWNVIQRLAYLASPDSRDDFARIEMQQDINNERREYETSISQYATLGAEYSEKQMDVPIEEKIKLAYKISDPLYRQMFCTEVGIDVLPPLPKDSGEKQSDFS
ncbi:MAG: hypothetical protein KAJ07_04650 [Planctomycetes bacterium]|nr:hypothetical protein [Planctomycetota bacterium]